MQDCQKQLGVFFGIHWNSNKMQKCWSQGTASEKQNCWAPPQPSESQDPEAEGGCVLVLWRLEVCCGWLTPPSVQHYKPVSVKSSLEAPLKVACQTLAASSLPLHRVAGLKLTHQWHMLTDGPILMCLVCRFLYRFYYPVIQTPTLPRLPGCPDACKW